MRRPSPLIGTSFGMASNCESAQKHAYLEAMGLTELPQWEDTPQWHYGTRLNGRRQGVTPSAAAAHYMATAQPGSPAPSKFNPLPRKKTVKKTLRPVRQGEAISLSLPHLRIDIAA